jgi:hypothetical protein
MVGLQKECPVFDPASLPEETLTLRAVFLLGGGLFGLFSQKNQIVKDQDGIGQKGLFKISLKQEIG